MDKRDFKLDFKIAKQKALHEWAIGLIAEVLDDTRRSPKEKFEMVKDIILDAADCEEEL